MPQSNQASPQSTGATMEVLFGGFAFAAYLAAQFFAVVAVSRARLDDFARSWSPECDDQLADHRAKLIWQSGV